MHGSLEQIHAISYNTLKIYTRFTLYTIGDECDFNSTLPNIHLKNTLQWVYSLLFLAYKHYTVITYCTYIWKLKAKKHRLQNNMEDTRKGPIIFKPDKKMQPLPA